jgi:hypothetical protein
LESAIRIALQPGNYTAVLSGKNNTTGVGLVEVYDIEKSVSSALTNVSTRAFVGTDQNVLIGGFIISGTGPKKLVVRALGPTLSSFGVPAYPPTVSKQADFFADAVINSRPLLSTSALSTIRVTPPAGSQPETSFGNPHQYNNQTPPTEWNDPGREELFAKIYNLATTRSRNFRVFVTGQSLDKNRNVLSTVTKVYQVFVKPNRAADGTIQSQQVVIKLREFHVVLDAPR